MEEKIRATKEIHHYTISRMCCIPFSGDETGHRVVATTLDVVKTPFEYLWTVIPTIGPSNHPGLKKTKKKTMDSHSHTCQLIGLLMETLDNSGRTKSWPLFFANCLTSCNSVLCRETVNLAHKHNKMVPCKSVANQREDNNHAQWQIRPRRECAGLTVFVCSAENLEGKKNNGEKETD